jgi:hypothetical protein
MVDDFFAMHRNPSQMALAPVYGFAFRNGLVAPAGNSIAMNYPEGYLFQQVPYEDNSGRWGTHVPYNTRLALTTAIRSTFDGADGPDFSLLPDGPGLQAATGSGETTVDGGAGILATSTPRFVSITGFMNENGPHGAGPLKVLSGNDFAVVNLLSLTSQPLSSSNEALLTVSSRAQNTNMAWNGNSVQDGWGQPPTEVQPIQLSVEIEQGTKPPYLRIHPLSPVGEEGSFRVVAAQNGRFSFDLDQSDDGTLWYGLAFTDVSAADEPAAANRVSIAPNPADGGRSFVEVAMETASPLAVRLLDVHGRLVKNVYENENPVKAVRERIETGSLAKGVYFVECRSGAWVQVEKLVIR